MLCSIMQSGGIIQVSVNGIAGLQPVAWGLILKIEALGAVSLVRGCGDQAVVMVWLRSGR